MYGSTTDADKPASKGKKNKSSKKEKKSKEREEEVVNKLPPAFPTTDVSHHLGTSVGLSSCNHGVP